MRESYFASLRKTQQSKVFSCDSISGKVVKMRQHAPRTTARSAHVPLLKPEKNLWVSHEPIGTNVSDGQQMEESYLPSGKASKRSCSEVDVSGQPSCSFRKSALPDQDKLSRSIFLQSTDHVSSYRKRPREAVEIDSVVIPARQTRRIFSRPGPVYAAPRE